MPGFPDVSRFLADESLEERQHALEIERRRLADLQVTPKSLPHYPYGYSMDHLNQSEGYYDSDNSKSNDVELHFGLISVFFIKWFINFCLIIPLPLYEPSL